MFSNENGRNSVEKREAIKLTEKGKRFEICKKNLLYNYFRQ